MLAPDALKLSTLANVTALLAGDMVPILRTSATLDTDKNQLAPASLFATGVAPAAPQTITAALLFPFLEAGTGIAVTLTSYGKINISSTVTPTQVLLAPPAPTNGLVDDTANTLSGDTVPGYPAAGDYEVFGVPGFAGNMMLTATGGDVQNGRVISRGLVGSILPGGTGIRVAASGSRPAGAWLLNAVTFTGPAAPTTPAGGVTVVATQGSDGITIISTTAS